MKTETAFTPGPWVANRFEPNKIDSLPTGGTAIHAEWKNADGYSPLIATLRPHWSNSACDANARLIAEAPEMFHALNRVCRIVESRVPTEDTEAMLMLNDAKAILQRIGGQQ